MNRPTCLADMGYTTCQHPRVYYTPAGTKDYYTAGVDGKWVWHSMALNDMHCALCNAEFDWQFTKQWRGGDVKTAIQYQYLPKDYLQTTERT